MQNFVLKKEVTRAEIYWCLQAVMTHCSLRNSEDDCKLMKLLFPDSKIADKIALGKTKISYATTYGIGPYFQTELQKLIADCDYIVVGFDESLNKYAQAQQIDVNLRFWHSVANEINTR